MYNMYNTQWDEDTDDDKKSLNSSFWSDGEDGEEEEEIIDSKPVTPPFGALQGISEEKTQQLNSQVSFTGEVLEGSNNDEVSSCGSPAPSLMTSGYGTLRAEEQEVGDHRDSHTITEFDQDSRADLSETKDDDEDRPSFCSFDEFDSEAPHEPDVSGSSVCPTESNTLVVDTVRCRSDALEEINISDTKPERKEEEQTEEEEHRYEVTKSTLADHHLHIDASRDTSGQSGVEEGTDVTECDEQEELQTPLTEPSVTEDRVQTDDDDEEDAARNKSITSTDSTLEFSWMTHGKTEVDWPENLRHGKGRDS